MIGYGNAILRRQLPKPVQPLNVGSEWSEWHLGVSCNSVQAGDFEISFTGHWTVGTLFELQCSADLHDLSILHGGERVNVKVYPVDDGPHFTELSFGRYYLYSEGHASVTMHLPRAVAYQMLQELRISPQRALWFSGKKLDNGVVLVANVTMT